MGGRPIPRNAQVELEQGTATQRHNRYRNDMMKVPQYLEIIVLN